MTIHYVDDSAGGSNDGTSWADAWTDFDSCLTVTAGDTVLVAHTHSQSYASSPNLNFSNGTKSSPVLVLSANSGTGAYTPGAAITQSGSNGVVFGGNVRIYGMSFVGGSATMLTFGNGDQHQYFEDCVFNAFSGVGVTYYALNFTSNGRAKVTIVNSTFDHTLGSAGANYGWGGFFRSTNRGGDLYIDNCSFVFGGSVTGTFVTEILTAISPGVFRISNCDLSFIPTLVNVGGSSAYDCRFSNCNLKSSYAVYTGTIQTDQEITVANSTSGTISVPALGLNNYENYYGSIASTLSVYRTGGADDGLQTNAYSWGMTTNSNALEIYKPLASPPISVFVDPDASPSGATAQGLLQSSRCDPLATPAALTTDSGSTWNGSGVGTKQKITLTIGDYTATVYVASGVTLNNDDFWVELSAPDQVGGPLTARFFLAVPSTTVYVDPKIEVA